MSPHTFRRSEAKMMKYAIDNDLHIHSLLSSCSDDPEQTNESILAYAEKCGITTLCLTNHFWDSDVPGASDWYAPQDFAHIKKALPLPQSEKVRFLFGCEVEMDKFRTLGIDPAKFSEFDFMIISTTHFHMTGFTLHDEERATPEARARAWEERLSRVLSTELPFGKIGIAHLACKLIAPTREEFLDVMKALSESEMERLFTKAAELGVGIELNLSDMSFAENEAELVLRPFRVAKRSGCKFYLGSDAHHPKDFESVIPMFSRAVDMLGLTEEDKFHI